MGKLSEIKCINKDFSVVTMVDIPGFPIDITQKIDLLDKQKSEIIQQLQQVENNLSDVQKELNHLNSEIDRLTNHANGLDYLIAAGSGILAGMVDLFYVGEFSLSDANKKGEESVKNFVMKMAKLRGYEGDDFVGAVRYLEKEAPIPADKATNLFGGGLQHHLRDFSHHPTPVGLFFSILTQFTGKIYGTDVHGRFLVTELDKSGINLIGKDMYQKFTFGIINWFFHMASDMAGSSGSIAKEKLGMGLPGPIVSFLKELSTLPIFQDTNKSGHKKFSVLISKLFNGTLLGEHDEDGKITKPLKFDLRTEIGMAKYGSKQAAPVIINECMIRGFYFLRRFYDEIKCHNVTTMNDLRKIDWVRTLPVNNRTVIRMLTISTGIMVALDLADAAIRAWIKTGGLSPKIFAAMVVRVNFVGMGRFAMAVYSDVKMGIQRNQYRTQRIALMNKQLLLLNSKVYYKQASMWIEAERTDHSIRAAYVDLEEKINIIAMDFQAMKEDLRGIKDLTPGIRKKNPGLIDEILKRLQ